MKKLIPVLCLFVFFSSCVKEMSEPVTQQIAGSSAVSEATASKTKFGAMVTGNFKIDDKIDIYRKLKVNYIRYTIVIKEWKGSDGGFDRYTREGFKVICNINQNPQPTKSGKPYAFVSDITTYKKKLTEILNKYKPEVVSIENEETNLTYHSGSMNKYISQLQAAVSIVHSKGLKVTDGGIHPRGLCYFVWKDYKDRGMNKEADDWMKKTFNTQMKYAAEHPERKDNEIRIYWNRLDTLLNAFKTTNIDFVNLHIYEPINDMGNGITTIPGCIQTMADYVRRRTGKAIMSNECGQHNTNSTLVTSMLQAFSNADYKYAIWFSGDGNNAKSLANSNGSLRSNGVAFQSFVGTY